MDARNRIKIIQFNADRGKAPMNLVEKVFADKYDVALLQEPYAKHKHRRQYRVNKWKYGRKVRSRL